MATNDSTRVVVIGAGYAGLLATMRLAGKNKHANVNLTLVNASDKFVERLRLHQFAANQTVRQRSIRKLLQGTGVQFVRGHVTRVDPAGHDLVVETEAGTQTITYDYLLYALGSTIDRDRVPGVRENAYTLTPEGTRSVNELRNILPALNATRGRLLVCGGGATGIETAAEFAESYPRLKVQLVTRGELGKFFGKYAADYMRQSLTRLGVEIQDRTTIAEIRADSALTTGSGVIPFDVCLWAGGFSVPRIAREAGLAVNERGQILIDPFMRSISHPDIFAVGDAAMPVQEPSVRVRMSAFTATIMGAHGADTLTATLQHKTPRPLSFAYLGQGIALGRHNAIGFNNIPDDKPHAPYFTGRLGYEGRELFVNLLADLARLEKGLPGVTYWLGKGRFEAMQRQHKTLVSAKRSA